MKPKLIIIRGNSGSGKSSLARLLREVLEEPFVYVEQDYIRRTLVGRTGKHKGNFELTELTKAMITSVCKEALTHSISVILEGILTKESYQPVIEEIIAMHPENNYFFYTDTSLEETIRRHQTKPNKNEFGEKEMRAWYKEKDLLDTFTEVILPEKNSLEENLTMIIKTVSC